MTHGSGGFSGGGGGGGGGIGHSGHGGAGDNECGEALFAITIMGVNVMGILLCIRKMSRFARIALLWLYILTIVLTVSLLLGLRILGTNTYQAAPTDMRRVDEKVNNAFCQSLDVSSTEPFTAYVLDHDPVVDSNSSVEYNTSYRDQFLKYNHYEYWGFYLIEGSTLVVRSSENVELFVIKGNASLQTWIDNQGNCDNCYMQKHYVTLNDIYTLNVTERENYFFLYFNNVIPNSYANVKAYFHIQRKLFDVSDASSTCVYRKGNKPCNFDLSLNPHQSVIVHNGKEVSFLDDNINMITKCYARPWLYFIVFVLIPVLIGMLISFLLWKFCKDDTVQEMTAVTDLPYDKM